MFITTANGGPELNREKVMFTVNRDNWWIDCETGDGASGQKKKKKTLNNKNNSSKLYGDRVKKLILNFDLRPLKQYLRAAFETVRGYRLKQYSIHR